MSAMDTADHLADSPVLRRLRACDLAQAQALSAAAGWPHRIEDWAFAHRIGMGYGAFAGQRRLVGTALWWPFGAAHGAVGMVIVARVAQGRGIGRRLMQAVLGEAGPRALVLNATGEGRRLYERLGFRPAGTVRQVQGTVRPANHPVPPAPGPIRPAVRPDLPAILALDRAATGMDRGAALRAVLDTGSGIVLERAGAMAGFAFYRRFGRGHVIGPVVASGDGAAAALAAHWLAHGAGQFVRIDVPAGGRALMATLARHGLEAVDAVTTMWRGAIAGASRDARVYGLINQALG